MGIIVIGMPFASYSFFHIYGPKLLELIPRFGSMYLNLKLTDNKAFFHTTLYFIRRLLMAFSLVFLDTIPSLQTLTQILLSFSLLCYQISVLPMSNFVA